MTVLYFLATIVLLVVIHEWGHFATARFFGVGVRSFTVGFGKQFVSWVDPKTGTRWGIAPYPVGGYVGLLGEKDAADAADAANAPTVTGKPFMDAPLHAKLAILFAGPLVNLVFAAFLYAILSYTAPNPALPILASPVSGSPAALAGIKSGDIIQQINGTTINSWRDVQRELVQLSTGDTLTLGTSASSIPKVLQMPTINAKQAPDEAIGFSLLSNGLKVQMIVPDGPASKAGIRVDDVLMQVNERLIDHPLALLDVLRAHKADSPPLVIEVRRAGQTALATITPQLDKGTVYRIGVQFTVAPKLSEDGLGLLESINDGFYTAYTASILTVKAFGAFLLKPFSSEQLAGPITIAQTAKASADRGLAAALAFVAGLSISVGVLNLLPVPMLDGGQIVYHSVSRIATGLGLRFKMDFSEQLNRLWVGLGIGFVLSLTALAFFTDFKRLLT